MKLDPFAFAVIDWEALELERHPGDSGFATWRTWHAGALRVRMVDYSPGYLADHWCEKGHIILCLTGQLDTELADGSCHTLSPGMSYHVGDDVAPHRSSSMAGARLFIVD